MGVVYEAIDRERDGRVALKTFRGITSDAVLRLKDEFRVLQGVHHPNLVRLGELIEDRGQWFYTMELVDGVDFLEHLGVRSALAATGSEQGIPTVTMDPGGVMPPPAPAGRLRDRPLDEVRLREALAQLVSGLDALHQFGKVHRDIKPPNVLVAHGTGRVVILDFGLVVDVAREVARDDGPRDQVVGTVAYMAPEQAAAEPVGPPADWYAVGVLIYEALTGRLPFTGNPEYVLTEKQIAEPLPPAVTGHALRDLSALCMALLRRAPGERPTSRDILDHLRVRPSRPPGMIAAPEQRPFVGRDDELARLSAAFGRMRTGRPVAAIVRGESGVGKTFLAKQFIARTAERHPEVVVLAGRCYERESVPYKAFDGVIDELTRFLRRQSRDALDEILPPRVAFAAQVFPVLRGLEAIAAAARPDDVPDPQQQRTQMFAAVRELFIALAARHRVIVVIDDVQWTDADSLALLRELLRPPGAPAILYVATLRPTEVAPVAIAEIEKAIALADGVEDVQLGALSSGAAEELVVRLARYMGMAPPPAMRAIADETRGHPLFIQELVHHVLADGAAPGSFRLDDAIVARVARLDDRSRRLVELVTVAGRPLPQEAIARAAAADFDEFSADVEALRTANLVRTSGTRRADVVEPYHDRVREAVVTSLPPAERGAIHGRLALALEAGRHPDPETLAEHWRGAGQPDRAVHYALLAAEQASAAVAFGRAARLYRLALELGLPSAEQRREVTVLLADALANGGQGTAAAAAYFDAAGAGVESARRRHLELRGAEQLLRAGHINDGLARVGTVLDGMGMRVPRSPRTALVSLLYRRAALRLRGLRYVERAEADVPPDELERIDAAWAVALLGFVETVRGADFGTRHLRLALAAGEPRRLARAVAVEAVYASSIARGYTPRARELLELAERIAERSSTSYAAAFVTGAAGVVEHSFGHYAAARSHAERAERVFTSSCTGVAWELNLVQLIALICLGYEGELPELARRLGPMLTDAHERGDLFAVSSLQIIVKYRVHLLLDQPDEARRTATDAMARWTQDGFQMQHRHELVAHGEIDVYCGRAGDAHRRYEERWRALKRSLLLEAQQQRVEIFDARARAAIAAAGERDADPRALYAFAERCAALIERDRLPWADALAAMLRAGVAARRGTDDRAVEGLGEALRGFEAAGMALHAAIARRALGKRLQGDAGRALVAAAEAWFDAAQVKDVDRTTALLAPGFSPS
jgi:eukaryotic-like serine/threonine-protein kinase